MLSSTSAGYPSPDMVSLGTVRKQFRAGLAQLAAVAAGRRVRPGWTSCGERCSGVMGARLSTPPAPTLWSGRLRCSRTTSLTTKRLRGRPALFAELEAVPLRERGEDFGRRSTGSRGCSTRLEWKLSSKGADDLPFHTLRSAARPRGGQFATPWRRGRIEKIKVKPCPTCPLPRNLLLNICRTDA
jgi:hypothetical protein